MAVLEIVKTCQHILTETTEQVIVNDSQHNIFDNKIYITVTHCQRFKDVVNIETHGYFCETCFRYVFG